MQEQLVQMVNQYNKQGLTVFAVPPHCNIFAYGNDPSSDIRNSK
jgi:glutathione peroxidase-family protein